LPSLWEHLGVDAQDDPEARIRELERSLSDAADKSELGAAKRGDYDKYQPQTPAVGYGPSFPPRPQTTAGFRGWRIVLAVVTVGLVALAAGVAIVIARLSSGGSTTGLPGNQPTITTSGTTTQANKSLQTLYPLLPPGYDSNNCSPIGSPNRQALATVECRQTSDPRSPPYAAFTLYPNETALANAFQSGIDEDTITQCPNGNRPPITWHTKAAPNVPAGSLACGNFNNAADLLFTKNSDLLLGDIQGPDLNALYQFFLTL
jgi:serine/threonine kinase PknH